MIAYHHKRLRFNTVVLHPVDIEDFDILKRYDLPIAFENMDWRKSRYRTVADMKGLLEKYHGMMVYDIQHAYSNDPSGALADDFSLHLKKKMVEVHLSGIDDKNDHRLLFEQGQSDIIKKVPENIPIIIESDKPETKNLKRLGESLKQELDYIKKYSRKKSR